MQNKSRRYKNKAADIGANMSAASFMNVSLSSIQEMGTMTTKTQTLPMRNFIQQNSCDGAC
jgi:hypothetical protein